MQFGPTLGVLLGQILSQNKVSKIYRLGSPLKSLNTCRETTICNLEAEDEHAGDIESCTSRIHLNDLKCDCKANEAEPSTLNQICCEFEPLKYYRCLLSQTSILSACSSYASKVYIDVMTLHYQAKSNARKRRKIGFFKFIDNMNYEENRYIIITR